MCRRQKLCKSHQSCNPPRAKDESWKFNFKHDFSTTRDMLPCMLLCNRKQAGHLGRVAPRGQYVTRYKGTRLSGTVKKGKVYGVQHASRWKSQYVTTRSMMPYMLTKHAERREQYATCHMQHVTCNHAYTHLATCTLTSKYTLPACTTHSKHARSTL